MTINYYLDFDPKSRDIEKAIYCFVRERAKTLRLHTGERIEAKHWDTAKQTVKKSYVGSPELNAFLVSFKEEVKKVIRQTRAVNPLATFDEIRDALLQRFKSKHKQEQEAARQAKEQEEAERIAKEEAEKNSFFNVWELFVELRKHELSVGTLKKYASLKAHLNDFEADTEYAITFETVGLIFFDKFSNYLLTKKNLTNNTSGKYFGLLKTFLNWATERKINPNADFVKFKTKSEKVETIYLTETELLTLHALDLSGNASFAKIRDFFCFSCFTGQRYSDVSAIKHDQIKDGIWHLRTQKTKDVLKVPLTAYALEILAKYEQEPTPLPVISSQKTNEYLKELCAIAGITETVTITHYKGTERIEEQFRKCDLVTNHTARRTFVTLSLEKGMRPETVMEITGHKDFKTFKKYVKISQNVVNSEMKKTWNK